MLQQIYQAPSYLPEIFDLQDHALRGLAYRSVAVVTPTDAELLDLQRAAQRRNKAEGLSGVLVFDRGVYFQWLEGPGAALARVWDSISRDPRHHQISVLRDEPLSQRIFDGWDFRVVKGDTIKIEAAVAALQSPSTQWLKHVLAKPTSRIDMSWEDLFATTVIPRLLEVHSNGLQAQLRRQATPNIWHAELDSGLRLASILLAHSSGDTVRYVDSLIEQGATFNALYHEVFEPAQLQLGKLWDAECCDDFSLSVGLARLLLEVRRLNAAVPREQVCKPGHSVLLCPQPTESHNTGLAMSCEVFDRRGWDVTCDFPGDDQSLLELVRGHWYDVLKLSQSGSLRRDGHLLSMRDTIDATRLASLNPALIIMVDGRTFAERPQVYRAVHAHAGSRSVLEAVPIAERLLCASRTPLRNLEVGVS